jgi:succinate dehydrogenase/fumarate reductase flavoprotein subunit
MRRGYLITGRDRVPLIECRVCVVGSGAAGLGTAVHLGRMGVSDVVIVTERLGGGASANAGSDKQTYYRVNPSLEGGDGVYAAARELFSGGAMHGDIALVEAALSERGFYRLIELGVPFPHDRYGVYPGYRTDHDSVGRGSSAGPATSIMMFERLLDEVRRLGIPIVDDTMAVELVTEGAGGTPRIAGLLGLERARAGRGASLGLVAVRADYVVLAVGGPGGLYRDSVYPGDQVGGLGAALAAGAAAHNLTESQFGIASTGIRWNLSGSYQQVLPRYISTDADGGNEREFLADGFSDPDLLFTAQFLKGYEWPFDARKLSGSGSSLVDLLVFHETVVRGRRVFLDFSRNPSHGQVSFSAASAPDLVRQYLAASDAFDDTPVGRLRRLNEPAYGLFLGRGIDLARDRVPVAVCHQHVNGGLAGSVWWETTIRNLFAVGECNGSHGIYRPGGAALNAGQVGSLRAAQMIAHRMGTPGPAPRPGGRVVATAAGRMIGTLSASLHGGHRVDPGPERDAIGRRMSRVMGIVRNARDISDALDENREMIRVHRSGGPADGRALAEFVRNGDLLVTEGAFLASAKLLLESLSGPRGSFLVGDTADVAGWVRSGGRNGPARIVPDDSLNDRIVECMVDGDLCARARFAPVRPIPGGRPSFERVWAAYREGAVYRETPEEGGSDE